MALGLKPVEIVEKKNYPLLAISPHWERVFLKNLADVQNGFAFSSKLFTKNKGMPLIRIRDISNNETENYYDGEYDQGFIVNKGDILIGMDGDFNVSIWGGKPGLLNQRVCRIKFKSEKYSEKFLFICLQPYLEAINVETSSVTVKHLSSRTVEDIPLPLPPLPEQNRIVAKIEELFSELDNGIENLKKAQEQLKTYRQAVLKYAFEGKLTQKWRVQQIQAGNPPEPAEELLERIRKEREKNYKKQLEDWGKACKQAKTEGKKKPAKPQKPKELPPLSEKELAELPELPEGWVWVMVNEISEVISGQHILKDNYNENKEGIAYLTGPADFDLIYPKISKWTTNPKAIAVQNNILITVKGAGVGKTNILDVKKAAISRQLMSVNLIKGDHTFVFRFFEFNFNKFQKLGLGSTVPGIDRNAILSFVIPFCSILEQNIIVQEIESRLSVCDQLEQTIEDSLKKAEALRQSILKKAFSGELTKDWREKHPELISGENSAARLLERIKAEKEKTRNHSPQKRGMRRGKKI